MADVRGMPGTSGKKWPNNRLDKTFGDGAPPLRLGNPGSATGVTYYATTGGKLLEVMQERRRTFLLFPRELYMYGIGVTFTFAPYFRTPPPPPPGY